MILALAPHPDDIELSCGASISYWRELGHKIVYVPFSPCKASTDVDLYAEMADSLKVLGIELGPAYDTPVRHFGEHRQLILDRMVHLNAEYSPDIVLCPNSMDVHQDHQVIHQEAVRAFKYRSILGYELPWNSLEFKSNYHVALPSGAIAKKIEALSCYKSQSYRNYFDKEFILGWARMRGIQIGEKYAESFELIRWIEG